jgi:type IV pilus assembly protein PilC
MTFTPGQLAARGDFYFQLASLITAGIPLIQALEMTRRNAARSFRPRIEEIVTRLQTGSTFGEALGATGGWLPAFDREVITASEQTGRLDRTLKMLGNDYKERAVLLRRMLSEMAYPIFIVHFAILLFMAGGVESFVAQKLAILLPLYIGVAVLVVALQGNRAERWRAMVERVLAAIPLVGSARKSLALARFSAGLEALLSAGVPIIESWEIAGTASGSDTIKKSVGRAVPLMRSGMTPSEVLQQLAYFPEMFRSLYASGEVSGQLDSTLERLHRHYQEEASLRFQYIGQWTPKVLFLLVALGVGWQIFSFYTNYFNQIGNLL